MKRFVWNGPYEDGVSQTLLSNWIECPERFRLKTIEGLVEDEGFDFKLEYGSIMHNGLEHLSDYRPAVKAYGEELKDRYPSEEEEIDKWIYLALGQLEIYRKHWSLDDAERNYLRNEETFSVKYELPSGRTVRLRGMWDAVFGEKNDQGGHNIFLQENKVRGYIKEDYLLDTLHKNLQLMMYLIPLRQQVEKGKFGSRHDHFQGCLYNVIRRPLSDKFSPRQKKSETLKKFWDRVLLTIEEDPAHHFKRIPLRITSAQMTEFQTKILNPLLEKLCVWWEHILDNPYDPWQNNHRGIHWEKPFGVFEAVGMGFDGTYYKYLTRGSTMNLKHIETVFPELETE